MDGWENTLSHMAPFPFVNGDDLVSWRNAERFKHLNLEGTQGGQYQRITIKINSIIHEVEYPGHALDQPVIVSAGVSQKIDSSFHSFDAGPAPDCIAVIHALS